MASLNAYDISIKGKINADVWSTWKYKVKIHARDHNPPHVHFEFSDIVVRVDIFEIAVMSIAGKPTRKELCIMLEYVGKYSHELMEGWNEYQKED